ncbi:MAG: type III-B CRISPR-associated protein Cas10/Cmr2 [Chlorobiaceae bacterium]|nr:type III-B CRISPR-associated protein Cas10/Cmr2 [Chlorobiaceae bacterium]
MSSQQYLFLFTIGPVQGFIEQARKTRDLFAGSQILSVLTDAAMNKVAEINGTNSFVFPHKGSTSKPNRFLAIVSTDDIQAFGDAIEAAVRTKWARLATESFHSAGLPESLPILDEALIADLSKHSCLELIARQSSIAARQIAEFPDVYWAAIEYDGTDYVSKSSKLEQLLAGVKNVRMFCQLNEEEGSRKCALDGQRTALFYRSGIDKNGKERKPNYLSNESDSIKGTLLDPGEALSAVSLVKRYYRKDERGFPSTAEIAMMDRCYNNEKSWEDTCKKYFDCEVDYQLFYKENLTKKSLEKQGIKTITDADLDKISNDFCALTGNNPTKYYALLLFDGDDFGELWSGVRLHKGANLMDFQRKLAEQLHNYAAKARCCLDKPKGQAVYTGGDDFLGFVNLNFLFKVLAELRQTFDEIVSEPLRDELMEGKRITFTAGVAIAHYKTPLGEVLKKASAVEKRAKELRSEKDAYGIAVMKHSGETREGFLPFNSSEQTDTLNALKRVVDELQHPKGFSNTFIHAFAREMHSLVDREEGAVGLNDKALRTELGRLLSRSAKTFGSEKEKKVDDCLEVVDSLRYTSESALGIQNFLSILEICDFIKRETSKDQL